MNLSPTSRTLFLVQIGTFISGFIVILCCCLYLSAYPKSPDSGSVSAITCVTLAFALISTITTLVLVIRQKSGRTVNAKIEGVWVGIAIILWILASVGGIAKPANDMRNVSCKVLPSGKDTDDKNYMRACQSMFASTAFCILSALFFMATAVILVTFSIQRAVRDKKAARVKVGGNYQLGPSPSQYRRAEERHENPLEETKDIEAASPSTDPASAAPAMSVMTPAMTAATATGATDASAAAAGHISNHVYQNPETSTLGATVAAPAAAVMSPHTSAASSSPYNTYAGSGHVPQASYQSTVGGYNNSGYLGQSTPTATTITSPGHVQQGSTASNMSGYDHQQYHPNPYANAGSGLYLPPQQMPYPPQQQQPAHGAYPMMGAPHRQSPYGTQFMPQSMPQGQPTPVMAMPRPEYF
ncbi:hypothetical protein EDD11_004936 [Mortierella claussenii]|nr:hypothetical protein EDD11_004936 [Mortierella claussenii]